MALAPTGRGQQQPGGSKVNDDGTVDADYEVVDDDNK